MKVYTTEQRKVLSQFFQERPDFQFSVEELTSHLCKSHDISISAIYRNVSFLMKEGIIGRFTKEGSRQFLYQYIGDASCHSHLHLKCEQCGRIIHMNDVGVNETLQKVLHQTQFHLDLRKTVLHGHCKDCR